MRLTFKAIYRQRGLMVSARNGQVGKALDNYQSSPLTHCSGGENEAMDQGSKILGGKAVVILTLIFLLHCPVSSPIQGILAMTN